MEYSHLTKNKKDGDSHSRLRRRVLENDPYIYSHEAYRMINDKVAT